MRLIISIVHVFVAVCLVTLVLLQHGKGADIGTGFGNTTTASSTMFGSIGAAPFLMKMTIFLAVIFFSTSIGLSHMAS